MEDFTSRCELDDAAVTRLDLPQDTKAFLLNAGLPRSSELLVSFMTFDGTFPTMNDFCRNNGIPYVDAGDALYRIGSDEGYEFCLTKGSGEVVAVSPVGELPDQFVSSNIEHLMKCLACYREYGKRVQSMTERAADLEADSTISKMTLIDPKAFSDGSNWWSCVAEQMQSGMR